MPTLALRIVWIPVPCFCLKQLAVAPPFARVLRKISFKFGPFPKISEKNVANLGGAEKSFSSLEIYTFFSNNRHLRSVCNFLIAFDAFLYALNIGVDNILLTTVIEALWPSMPVYACFLSQMLFMIVYEMTAEMPLVIGLERLFNVCFPFWLHFNVRKSN